MEEQRGRTQRWRTRRGEPSDGGAEGENTAMEEQRGRTQ